MRPGRNAPRFLVPLGKRENGALVRVTIKEKDIVSNIDGSNTNAWSVLRGAVAKLFFVFLFVQDVFAVLFLSVFLSVIS